VDSRQESDPYETRRQVLGERPIRHMENWGDVPFESAGGSNDPYETRRPWDYWQAQQKDALDELGFDDAWYEKEMIKAIRRGDYEKKTR